MTDRKKSKVDIGFIVRLRHSVTRIHENKKLLRLVDKNYKGIHDSLGLALHKPILSKDYSISVLGNLDYWIAVLDDYLQLTHRLKSFETHTVAVDYGDEAGVEEIQEGFKYEEIERQKLRDLRSKLIHEWHKQAKKIKEEEKSWPKKS
tara:strand:- start:4915 stop:5358 length:444 start_codon:yes stop_codon:yes gene_type:complete